MKTYILSVNNKIVFLKTLKIVKAVLFYEPQQVMVRTITPNKDY